MVILPVSDPSFRLYGRVVEGYDVSGVLDALAKTPLPAGTDYVPHDESVAAAPGAQALGEGLFGGMPFQLGWCNGHNTKLNCLEYHRGSELNIGVTDFVLLLAKAEDYVDGRLDTEKVKAFRAPAGAVVQVYETSFHYAPCQTSEDGFRVAIVLPKYTNTDKPEITPENEEDKILWARNKWLIAHEESSEAAAGAVIGLFGRNIDIAE